MGEDKLKHVMDYEAVSNVLCQSFILRYSLDCWERTRVLINSIKPLRKKGWVLDVGTSAGDHLLSFKDETNFVCLDLSLSALKLLKKRDNQTFPVCADAQKVPFRIEVFDSILAGDIMEHLIEDKIFLEEIFYILKRGGILSLSVPRGKKLTNHDIRAGHLRRYSKSKLKELSEIAKFTIVYVTSWGFPVAKVYNLITTLFLKLQGGETFASEGNLQFARKLSDSIIFRIYLILLPLLKRLVKIDYAFMGCNLGDWLILKAIKTTNRTECVYEAFRS